ncbi:MAG: AAA family ATPase [Actinomycetaceae bacterium]|nr:AAA family ATPase [Actinomycetaceae bacterium]
MEQMVVKPRALAAGSCWRKWDLHVHTPTTKLNNQYENVESMDASGKPTRQPNWDKYCRIIEESDVRVFGITDYFSFDSYFEFKKRYSEKYPESDKVFFPNLELRLDIAVHDQGAHVNVHLIFPDTLSEGKAEDFLRNLKVSNTNRFGDRNLTAFEVAGWSKTDLETVSVTFDAIVSALVDTFDGVKESNLEDAAIIVISGGKDGLSPGKMNPRKGTIIDNIDQKVHGVFSNSTNASYWLNPDKRSQDTQRVFKPHPTFYGCDAHSFEVLEKCLGKTGEDETRSWECTWIKAEPTWEGLLQTLIEPESRVKIQEMNPDSKVDYRVIKTVRFPNSAAFPNQINFNPDLNSIIGSRSSGKSALLAHIAYAIDKEETVKQQNNAGMNNPGPAAGLKWDEVAEDRCEVMWRNGATGGRVIYVPQNLLNGLSARQGEVDKLIGPAVESMDLSAYEQYQLRVSEIAEIKSAISKTVSEWFSEKRELKKAQEDFKTCPDKKAVEDEIRKLEQSVSDLIAASDRTLDDAEKYKNITLELERKTEDFENSDQLWTALSSLFAKSSGEQSGQPGLLLREDVVNVSVKLGLYEELVPEDVEQRLRKIESDAKKDMDKLVFDELFKEHEASRKAVESERKKLEELEKEKAGLETSLRKSQEILEYENAIAEQKQAKKKIDLLKSKIEQNQESLMGLAGEIEELIGSRKKIETRVIDDFNSSMSRHNTNIRYRLEGGYSEEIVEEVSENYNARAKHRFMDSGKLLLGEIQGHVSDYLEGIFDDVVKVKTRVDPESVAVQTLSLGKELRFSAVMDGDSIGGFEPSTMTPGKQAMFALTLILNDVSEEWPLLIDQPEDDLDSKSIYTDVVRFLKQQKERRQIIMVTHNANLVVGADSELVVVANRHGDDRPNEGGRTFDYLSGALENSAVSDNAEFELDKKGIREHVVDLLDGGAEAFLKRSQKYKL